MHTLLISLLLIPAFFHTLQPVETPQSTELEIIIDELDLALDSFFSLLDEEDLDVFISGVRHASRARLLLEQYLGEDIDDLSREAYAADRDEYRLRQIAKRASDLSGDAGREIWRQDFEDKQAALLRLSELEHMVKYLKMTTSDQ